MTNLNKTENVKHQYSSDNNLSARINLHAKHSTNKKGFYPWLFEYYQFSNNDKILELGCGNGMQWKNAASPLPPDSSLILSDFSNGMLEAAKKNLSPTGDNISFQQIDIQTIPFASQTFNTVIANHMLYHVPDLDKALSEVHRVLKKDGTFYAATGGAVGIAQYVHHVLKKFDPSSVGALEEIPFNSENGGEILARHFSSVKRYDYVDALAITETNDLIAWLESAMFIDFNRKFDGLYDYFEQIRLTEGAINIPKGSCLFICTTG
ncbi:MAG: class I SAM-dependent methyltransferase [Defluviitaleaceae bacterium]|nr:class I SAM-dependent methyltransferase [Defluviitaleaceae bacterium]